MQVSIRHGGVDSATLAEIFYHRYYDPPPALARIVGEPAVILDLGANVGLFGAFAAARWPRSQIVAFEPDPENAALLERTVVANCLGARWRLERAAVGPRNGEVSFATGLNVDSHIVDGPADAADEHVMKVRVHDVLVELAAADLVKMDIEGGEWAILCDPRFAEYPPRCLVLEYHPRGSPEPSPRSALLHVLERAGMTTESIWHGQDGHGMLWAWRP